MNLSLNKVTDKELTRKLGAKWQKWHSVSDNIVSPIKMLTIY